MQTFINVVPLVGGLWMVFTSTLMTTRNFQSAMVFKFIPLCCGLCSIFVGLKLFGVI